MRGLGRGVFRAAIVGAWFVVTVGIGTSTGVAGEVIRIAPATPDPADAEGASLDGEGVAGRRGFDYDAFQSRLDTLWFQRRASLAEGRDADAAKQAELIRAFASEEGVRRLEIAARALLAEADRLLEEGNFDKALAALGLAEAVDPGRPETRMARAEVFWKSGAGAFRAASEYAAAWAAGFARAGGHAAVRRGALVFPFFALAGSIALYGILLLVRHQAAIRHEIEETLARHQREGWGPAAGWGILALPLLSWIGAGWAAFYWIALSFRFQKRVEKAVSVALLVLSIAMVPLLRHTVGVYGLAADPTVRATLEASEGAYEPERIAKLREVVGAHPDDPTYRFLLAGLYKNGRFLEEAYQQYKQVLTLRPDSYQAHINIGNIFFLMQQYGASISQYKQALEIQPRSALAYYNMYIAQSEAFRLNEADQSLARAREVNPAEAEALLARDAKRNERAVVVDATVDFAAVWKASIEGRKLSDWFRGGDADSSASGWWRALLNGFSGMGALTLLACGLLPLAFHAHPPARRCVRCGRPFCHECKTRREGADYCTQCVHLFVLGDGLAPQTKSRKLYEVESFERRNRVADRIGSALLPGAGHVIRGRAATGMALVFLWCVAWIAAVPGILRPVERALGSSLRPDLLVSGPVPARFAVDPALAAAVLLAAVVWLGANLLRRRAREA